VHFSIPVFICATLPQNEEEAAAAAAAGKAKDGKTEKKLFLRFSKIKKYIKKTYKNAAKICALRRCFIAAVDGSSNTNSPITRRIIVHYQD